MSGPEFRQSFSQGWLEQFPIVSRSSSDEEGFLKRLDAVEWLEALAIRWSQLLERVHGRWENILNIYAERKYELARQGVREQFTS